MSEDLKWISDEMFEAELRLIAGENAQALLSVPGVYEALSDEYNNEVIRRLQLKKDDLLAEPAPTKEEEEQGLRSILADAGGMDDADHHECIKYAGKVVEGFGAHSAHQGVAMLAKCYLDLLANRTNEPVWLQVGRIKAMARHKDTAAVEHYNDGAAPPPSKADNIDVSPPPAEPAEDGKEKGREKRKFKVVVEWLLSSVMEVEADSIEQAMSDVAAWGDLPDDGSYVEGSWRVLDEFTQEENED